MLTHELPLPCIPDAREKVESQLAAARNAWIAKHATLGLEVDEETPVLVTQTSPLLAPVVEMAATAAATAALDSTAGDGPEPDPIQTMSAKPKAVASLHTTPPPVAPLTREQALQQAQAEGLALRKADSKSGYADVTVHPGRAKPYRAKVSRSGRATLGTFATAEEVALCVARGPRSLEWQEAAERAAAVALPRTQLTWKQQARDEIIGAVALEIIYQAAEAAAIELGAEVAAEVMAGITLGL